MYWQTVVDKLLLDNDIKLLQGNGNISHADMEQFVDAEYEKFDNRRKRLDALTADKQDLEELEEEIKKIK